MQKTNKSIAKRFKITGTGRVLRRSPNSNHMRSSKTTKQKRSYQRDKTVCLGLVKQIKRAIIGAF